ncbi:MAG: hypothetical protein ABW140_10610 [Candidatus Sedimenticola sp. 6PFRAG1]
MFKIYIAGMLLMASSVSFGAFTDFDKSDSELSDSIVMTLSLSGDADSGSTPISTLDAVPLSAAGWLFGSTLIGFVALSRRKQV